MSKYSSLDYWYHIVVRGNQGPQFFDNLYRALEMEPPRIMSVVGERTCNMRCAHCIFQDEESSENASKNNSLQEAVETIIRQMASGPAVVHEGRIFRPWHLKWLQAIRIARPDSRIGIIENGTYLAHAEHIEASRFTFDWIDVSIDGPERVHNEQRRSEVSFSQSIQGIRQARRFLSPHGRVSSLFTITSINYGSIIDTCKSLPDELNEWHITSLSPNRPEISHLATTEEEFAVAWSQVVQVQQVRPVTFRIYVLQDILKLAKAVGGQKLLKALESAKVDLASISFVLDGVWIIYYPQSVCTNEVFVIDSDVHYRMPYSVAFTLKEHHEGVSRFGEDIKKYTVDRIDTSSNFGSLYRKCVAQWRYAFGEKALAKEVEVFNQIRSLK